jgi:hypothetical protein
MAIGRIQLALCLLACTVFVSTASAVYASPRSHERPSLDDYDDPDQFVRELLAWKRKQRRASDHSGQESEPQPSKQDDWHIVTGPETLEGALQKARGYTPPDYEAKYRFNRTTHLSFPLPRLEGEQMSGQAITGGLRKQELEQRSLEPLPEMNMILEEIGDKEEYSGQPGQDFRASPVERGQKAVQVNTR